MFERFTDQGRRVIVMAQEHARRVGPGHIGTEHLVLGLTDDANTVAGRALGSLSIAKVKLFEQALEIGGPAVGELSGHVPFTPRAKQALERSLVEAQTLGHDYIGTEHILLGLIGNPECTAAKMLEHEVGELDRVRAAVIHELSVGPGDNGAVTSALTSAPATAPPLLGGPMACVHPVESLRWEAASIEGPTGPLTGQVIRCRDCKTAIGFASDRG